ncbi:phytanoyl-CoA dioxygenase family protein [Niveispirillum sp. BGYR6]|uniref:phytanoyl-CoA dioxygenase family protein n=1 Tax=Niveispirillum sp. BGYR6 TaxID=2971249 RepID=UPI0022B94DD9|nr:phytanoyl-CoA dioxygenase family protein [Niveispirillum sp. BGYR6]MDG5497469.1 phytanoyl-CoA dioxygenase family protein [Niveispirillum sp. BGYR6]
MGFEAQREQFRQEGYAVFERVLTGELLDILRSQCAEMVARADAHLDALGVDSDGITHRGNRYFAGECQRVQPALRRMLFAPVMADICRTTLGDEAYFFYDQYVVKGSGGGMAFAWHQDSGYVVGNGGPADHAPYLTCWCPLDDATVENGTIRLLPFSRVPASRDGIVPHVRQPGTNDLVGWAGDDQGVVIEAKAGSVVAFSSRLLHASGPNHSDQMRRVYLAQYSPEVILNPGTRQLRRDAIPLLRSGRQVTFG